MSNNSTRAVFSEPVRAAQGIFRLIGEELELVEREFEGEARSNVQVITHLSEHLRQSGGKRVRPALTVLANYAAGGAGRSSPVIRMATVMECLHTATLVHDDIIDNADKRRNRASINARYGNQMAVLLGDWLYMKAFETSLAERSWPVLDILTAVTRKMTEGELLQLTLIGRTDLSEAQYFDVLQRKTAFLFSACCEIGGLLAGASPSICEGLGEYGLHLGTAFQVIDDLLDCTTTESALGKAAGADLLEGKLTLPLIYLLRADEAWREQFQTVMWEGSYLKVAREGIVRSLKENGIGLAVKKRAEDCVARALASLEGLDNSPYKEALARLPGFILERGA